MDNDLKKLQEILLNMAEDICKVCDDNNIKYYICGGTQLGAVRHKGFIPWDDDFDIGINRNDYEKFLEICDNTLDKSKYFLQTYDTENLYGHFFAKIKLNGTKFDEEFSRNVNIHHGIFIDIFPYDNLPDNKFIRKIYLLKNKIYKNMIWIKCGYCTNKLKKKIYYKVIKLICPLINLKKLRLKRIKLLNKYNNLKTKDRFIGDYPNQIMKNEWLEKRMKFKFENTEFYGFKEYDEYLKMIYGDYMTLPPEEKRHVHTKLKIDFGKY